MAVPNEQEPRYATESDIIAASRAEALVVHDGELIAAVTGAGSAALLSTRGIGVGAWSSILDLPADAEDDGRMTLPAGALDVLSLQDAEDGATLYVATESRAGGRLMRRAGDGSFEAVFDGDLEGRRILGLHSLTCLGERLFAAPVVTAYSARPEVNRVFVCTDPAAGHWEPASAPAFGDENNLGITTLAVWREHLYAGTYNPERGFQLWRTDAAGEAPYSWELVLGNGARRYTLNAGVAALCAFGEHLYVATGLPEAGFDRAHDIGPAAAELLRLGTDGDWDVICGTARFAPGGLKVPLSAMGPGFHNPFINAISCLTTDGDTLYAGTFNCAALSDAELDGADVLPEVWSSTDGEEWEQLPVAEDGSLTGMLGISCMHVTDEGLVLGATPGEYHYRSPVNRDGDGGASPAVAGAARHAVIVRLSPSS
jgi:hypothetical protein